MTKHLTASAVKSRNPGLAMALWLACILPASGLSAAPAQPKAEGLLNAPLPKDPMAVTIHRLSNGMTVYLSPNSQEPRVGAAIAVRAGSQNDAPDSTGMAHYLEHMLFKGTGKLGTLDYVKEKPLQEEILGLYEKRFKTSDAKERELIYKEIDRKSVAAAGLAVPNELEKVYGQLGVTHLNAGTSYDRTTYTCEFPKNRADLWARVETDRFDHPVFRLFQSEIEAVYEEKNRYMDDAEDILWEAMMSRLYKGHPYSVPIIGTIDHLKNPSLAKMYAFFERYYVPNNMAIALSGDFDREEMLAVLEKNFGSLKPVPLARREAPKPEPLKGPERLEVKYEAEEKVVVSWPTATKASPDYEALLIMDMLMDNSVTGLLNLGLEQTQKVKDAGSYSLFLLDGGAWQTFAVPKQGQTLEAAEALLMETVAKLKAGDFTAEDIRAVVTDFEVSYKKSLEVNMRRADLMADSFQDYETWERTASRIERLKAVTKEDVLRVAKQHLGEGRVVVYRRNAKPELPSIAKPGFTKVDIDPSRQSAFFKELMAMPAKDIEPAWLAEGRDYSITPMPQGNLYATRNPFNDLFSIGLVFDFGSDAVREACAALDLLKFSGAGGLSAEDFKKKLYGLGAALDYGCGRDTLSVSLSGPDENLWPALELMVRRFEQPNTSPDMLAKMVAVQLGAHQDNKKDPKYIHYALGEFASRAGESAVLNELTDAELKKLDTAKLQAVTKGLLGYRHRSLYVGNRLPGEVAKLLGSESPKFRPAPARKPVAYVKPSKPRIVFGHRDMLQSWVGVYAADEVFDPESVVDYRFYTGYMGGSMSGVIFQEIRESRALAYSAYAYYDEGTVKGDENMLVGQVETQADKTSEASTVMLDLLHRLPPSAERFEEVRKSQEQLFRTRRIGFRQIPGTLVSWEKLGYAADPRPARFEKTLRYTLADLERFSARFKDRPMTLFILGNKPRLDLGGLKKLGTFEEKTLEQIFPY
ncbi:MAG: insulinase family protein [Elusimicrobia bacterium]|nr:insulinase family protein [Elusimicrobiota bacterium]